MASGPHDLGELEGAVNESARRASGLWLSFVLFATLVVITTGTVTHKDLFLEKPLKLPVLNVDLPLIGYFVAAPVFFVIFHFYVLLQLDGLAARVRTYNADLRRERPVAADEDRRRDQLDPFIFAQLLAGPRARREGRIGLLLRSVAWITMVGLPLGTLLLVQLIFLPYHHQFVTWWHRVWILLDLVLVWFFWQRVSSREPVVDPVSAITRRLRRLRGRMFVTLRPFTGRRVWRSPAATHPKQTVPWARAHVGLGVAVVAFTTLVAAFPTEWIYSTWLDWLWLGSNRLMLSDADFGIDEKLVAISKIRKELYSSADHDSSSEVKKSKVTLSLRGRDLASAVFDRTDLRQADFSGAQLPGARFQFANLDHSLFECTPPLFEIGRRFECANLRGAVLKEARLQGASFFGAHLQGAVLEGAQVQGASLFGAHLQGAALKGAQLQGANLRSVQLQGADLEEAHLQGAALERAQLQGANLRSAQLQGADLERAQLLGASVFKAQLQSASLHAVNVYRTQCPTLPLLFTATRCLHHAWASTADVRGIVWAKTSRPWSIIYGDPEYSREIWSVTKFFDAGDPTAVQRFIDGVVNEVPARWKQQVRKRLSILEPSARDAAQDSQLARRWMQERTRSLSPPRRGALIERLACEAESAPYVARGLMRNGRLAATRHRLHSIAERMRKGKSDPAACPGVKGFTDADWKLLDRLVKEAPPKPTAPPSAPPK